MNADIVSFPLTHPEALAKRRRELVLWTREASLEATLGMLETVFSRLPRGIEEYPGQYRLAAAEGYLSSALEYAESVEINDALAYLGNRLPAPGPVAMRLMIYDLAASLPDNQVPALLRAVERHVKRAAKASPHG